ncbi:hypothetical protein EB796_005760 [Bugula neritina]|uniref:CTCK domain-containing protein n=1 Tax=Bugula neritina TaxID=10212 RepID=A0A7J7KDJ0_BUGNE|nr:hypothetical protein EB796_005760 [Bugula neritina]
MRSLWTVMTAAPRCISKCSDCSPKPVTNQTLLTLSFTDPVHGSCTGLARGLNECSGYCSSSHTVGLLGAAPISNCKCCKPSKYEEILVPFDCTNSPTMKLIQSPTECDCGVCSGN